MKLLVVDDEISIREGICRSIDWGKYDIQCLTAKNGIQALDSIEKNIPDLVLLDVQMPHMDGLSVMEELKKQENNVKIIILSGYDQFSYAQKALKLGAVDYLIKPCHKNQLLETVLHFKKEIEIERQSMLMEASLQKQFQENLQILQERYLCRLLEKGPFPMPEVEENLKTLHIDLPLHNMIAAVMSPDCAQCILFERGKSLNEKDIALAKFGVKNIAEEIITPLCCCMCAGCEEGIVILIDMKKGKDFVHTCLQEITEKVFSYLGISLTIGIGRISPDISNICFSYREAFQALEMRNLLGSGEIFWYEKVFLSEQEKNMYSEDTEKKVIHAVFSRKAPELHRALHQFFDEMNNIKQYGCCEAYSLALCYAINHAMSEYSMSSSTVWKPDDFLKELLNPCDFRTITELVEKLALRAQAQVVHTGSNNRQILQNSIAFIRNNYQSDISLKDAAEYVYLSPNYFSMIFKQLSGVSFIDYLNSVRIEKACELLKNTHYKTYEIAFQVGFKDEKYFSHLFKKITGQSPSQYRKH